jgi:adenylate cyclase class IV
VRELKADIKDFSTQLNHYFIGGNAERLFKELKRYLSASQQKRLKQIMDSANELSIRTREINGEVKIVVKASVGSDSSSNGVSRIEFEETLPLSLGELDKRLLSAGYKYQAKWSRQREEYKVGGITICFDKNAGYGYLAEFEKVVERANQLKKAQTEIRKVMKKLEVSELPQSRLERMFSYYNKNWKKYYGTDKVFTLA